MMAVAGAERIFQTGGGPEARITPASLEALATAIRDAPVGTEFRIRGSGTWLDAGRPVQSSAVLDLSALTGIIEHVPGDLTLTALAGTTLAAIDAVAEAHGQWLPLDPFGARTGSLGATLATSSCGPLAATIGHPRDLALGIEVIDGAGHRQRAGGRVVKNVAGFDLVRLHVGAWGSLGVIASATVRLRALPPAERTIALPVPRARVDVNELLVAMRGQPLPPIAAELLCPSLSVRIGLQGRETLLVRFAGSQLAVQSVADRALITWDGDEIDRSIWSRLAEFEPVGAAVVRYGVPADAIAVLWCEARRVHDSSVLMHAALDRGILRVASSAPRLLDLESAATTLRSSRIVERGPFAPVPGASPALSRIARDLRKAFDPHRKLNPGIVGDDVY